MKRSQLAGARSILHVMKENDETIPVNLLFWHLRCRTPNFPWAVGPQGKLGLERCKYTLFKLSYFRNVRLTLKYTSKDDKQITILTIAGLSVIKNNENSLAQFIIKHQFF
jgi:hypothetical protein